MNLDLRIPMGLMFTITGAILTAYGIATRGDTELYARSLGVNANLWWGMVLFVFGLVMLLLGQRGQKRIDSEPPPPPPADGEIRRGH